MRGFSKNVKKEVRNLGLQNLNALENYLDIIFENVTQFSNLVFVDDEIQNVMRAHRNKNYAPLEKVKVQNRLSTMLLSADYIHTAILIEENGTIYKSFKHGPVEIDTSNLENKSWYRKVVDENKEVFLSQKDSVISYTYRPDDVNIIYVRTIPDKYDYSKLAVLFLIINESAIQNLFYRSEADSDSIFCLLDSENDYVVSPLNYDGNYVDLIKRSDGVLVESDSSYNDWKLSCFYPLNTGNDTKKLMALVLLTYFIINIIVGIICIILLRVQIFKPLTKIENHMKIVEEGIFVTMEVPNENNEITSLQRVNNHMINSIQELIETIKKEEKIITKNELDIIYAQINPHFLYNTLDAASALCLIKDNDNCFKVLRALGNFYRFSLNSGNDLITVEKEIETIESYVTILNVRYENRLKVNYDISSEVKNYRMLKMILQPVVENAVYHGIKERDGLGTINVKGYANDDFIVFEIEDDGVGMSEEIIDRVLNGKDENKKGFGLYSLIQRISLFYNIEKPVKIESRVGKGTRISIYLKILDSKEN